MPTLGLLKVNNFCSFVSVSRAAVFKQILTCCSCRPCCSAGIAALSLMLHQNLFDLVSFIMKRKRVTLKLLFYDEIKNKMGNFNLKWTKIINVTVKNEFKAMMVFTKHFQWVLYTVKSIGRNMKT